MQSQNIRRYDNLNALRALSAIGIALMHYQGNMPIKPSYGFVSQTLLPWLTHLVLLFFMISAFGMCCGYYERVKTGNMVPKQFYSRRYSRILPFFILLSLIGVAVDFSWQSVEMGLMNSTLLLSLMPVPHTEIIGVGWFLGTIFLFYIFFPYFVYLLDSSRKAWLVLIAAYILNLMCNGYFFTEQYGVSINPGRENILYSAVFLVAGGLMYLYRDRIYEIMAGRTGRWLLPVLMVLTIGYFVVYEQIKEYHWMTILTFIILFALWLGYAISPNKKWMHNPVMDFLSTYSMEIYLCHMLMFRVIQKVHIEHWVPNPDVQYPIICVLGLTMSVLFSWGAVKVLKLVKISK